jgi:hypothetical protein
MQIGSNIFTCVRQLYGTKEKLVRTLLWSVLLVHVFLRTRWSYYFLSHSLSPHLQYIGLLLLVDVLLALSIVFSLLYFKRSGLYLAFIYSILLLVLAYFTWGFDAIAGVILLVTSIFAIFKKMQMPVQTIRVWKAFFARLIQVIVLLSLFVNVAFFIALHA